VTRPAERAFRCSAASQGLDEPVAGTASTVRGLLLVETPGGWGVDAVTGSRLPAEVRAHLRELQRVHHVRPLLIRGHGRQRTGGTRLFAAFVGRSGPFAETTVLDDVRELLDLPVAGLASGQSPGLTPHEEPLFFVCTHGKHDACCAEQGRPLCKAMHDVAPEQTWEVSHIGGDRFAPNVLVLPEGLYYGRVSPDGAADFVDTVRRGELDLEHLRGRCAFPFAVQAAEVHLRRQLGARAAGAPRLLAFERGDVARVRLEVDGGVWEVRVATEPGEPRQLTCRATVLGTGLHHTVLGFERIT
jgi:hypothetical protein